MSFPGLRTVFTTRDQVKLLDRRVRPWDDPERWLTRCCCSDDVDYFAAHCLLPDSKLEMDRGGSSQPPTADSVTIDVRRGDCYSDPTIRAQFGFDPSVEN